MNNPFAEIDDRLNKIEQLLTQLLAQQPAQNNIADEVGGIALAEQVTGLKKATIYCHVHSNKIPYFKKGGRLHFSKMTLQKWITSEKVNEIINLPTIAKPLFPNFKNKVK